MIRLFIRAELNPSMNCRYTKPQEFITTTTISSCHHESHTASNLSSQAPSSIRQSTHNTTSIAPPPNRPHSFLTSLTFKKYAEFFTPATKNVSLDQWTILEVSRLKTCQESHAVTG
ncbi:hypothetical protein E2C01_099335 [Portunus trituberculatus]|uniref:Uncharacterized protein n=1 Tax=Portunus trituberculatus TaxID=210409 RepID=A0A5B7KEM3_PORTR|nr:hypothetical protein [Portunus trituberculatus]